MKIYKEKISSKLKEEILMFLEENKEPIIEYWSWRKALELFRLANVEIRKSVEDFGKEYDEIIQYYWANHKDEELTSREIQLIEIVNKKLNLLYSRYVFDIETRTLLQQLSNKKYEQGEIL